MNTTRFEGCQPFPRLVLLDLDGTLVDTVPDLAFCVDQTLRRLNKEPAGEQSVRGWVGNGVDVLLCRALTGRMDGSPDAAELATARELFLELYAIHTSRRSRVYPGVRNGLSFLSEHGATLGCVTNKPARFTERLLRDMGLYAHFALVVSGDTLPVKKPDPRPLLHAAEQLGFDPADSLLVGDSEADVGAARAADFRVICVSYGYNHGRDIRLAMPDAVIDSLAELGKLLIPLEK
jgi:phosphoglycolate phosphatase